MGQEGGDITRIHHARVIGDASGQIDRSYDCHSVLDDGLAGLGDLAVAATLGRQIDDYRAQRHALHHVLSYQNRGFFSWNYGGSDHHIAFLNDFSEQLTLAAIEIFILCASISTSI